MPPDCSEYRKNMELLALKVQMEKEPQDTVNREEIRKRIDVLEKELDLD